MNIGYRDLICPEPTPEGGAQMISSTGGAHSPRRRIGRLALATIAAGVTLAAITVGTGVASAAEQSAPVAKASATSHYGVTPFLTGAGNAAQARPAAASDLTYHGGYIQDHVAVYLV